MARQQIDSEYVNKFIKIPTKLNNKIMLDASSKPGMNHETIIVDILEKYYTDPINIKRIQALILG